MFECHVSGDGANYQGGGGVEEALNGCSTGEVDDTLTKEDVGGGGEKRKDRTTGATSAPAAAAEQRQQGQDDGGSCAGD